jgi:hypothetical protein
MLKCVFEQTSLQNAMEAKTTTSPDQALDEVKKAEVIPNIDYSHRSSGRSHYI